MRSCWCTVIDELRQMSDGLLEARLGDGEFATLDSLAYAFGPPGISATIKQEFEDFKVDEELCFDCSGHGEHMYLRVRKQDLSTPDVARRLQALTRLPPTAIGYSGMKDRRGDCIQWFSVQLPAKDESRINALEDTGLTVLETRRNGRKLKIGSHKLNHFQVRLRNCEGDAASFTDRLSQIQRAGVPNYFGEQRFGWELSNLSQVQALMEDLLGDSNASARRREGDQQFKRGMLYSAARAYLFNQVLSRRVATGSWNNYLSGDVPNLAGTDRCFSVAERAWDETLQRRLREFDIHLTGPLAGMVDSKDKYISKDKAADIEEAVLGEYPTLVSGLVRCGLMASRRPLRFMPGQLQWEWESTASLCLRFSLSRGCYATSLLREICRAGSREQLPRDH